MTSRGPEGTPTQGPRPHDLTTRLAPYVALLRARYQLMLQYRAAALAGAATQLFWGFIRIMILVAFYRSSDSVPPLSMEAAVTYVWLGQALLALLPWNHDLELEALIREGGVAYELLRPIDLYAAWSMRGIATRAASASLRSIPIVVVAGIALPLMGFAEWRLSAPASLEAGFAFAIAMVVAIALGCAIQMLVQISLLWTISGDGVAKLMPALVTVFSGMVIPLPFFPDWTQPLLHVLPFRALADVPYRLYTGDIPAAMAPFEIGVAAGLGRPARVGRSRLARTRQTCTRGAGRMTRIAKLRDAARLYGHLLAVSARAQMQYRASFVLQLVGQFAVTGVEFLGVWALFDRFGRLDHWSLAEAALFYGVANVCMAVGELLSAGFDKFDIAIKQGLFDRVLVRPRSSVLQLAGSDLALRRIGRLLQGAFVLAWAASTLQTEWSAGSVLLLGFAIVGGACLFFALFVLRATLCFWTVEGLEFMNTLTYGGVESAQYPLSIYAGGFRRFFTFVVPLACVCYFPVVAILGREDPLGSPLWFQYAAPAAGIAFLLATLRVWDFGVSRYTSTGS